MFKSPDKIREEFDEVALRIEGGGDTTGGNKVRFNPIKVYLRERLPAEGEFALDIGCGLGTFTKYLAERFDKVVALDISPEMIRLARKNTGEYANIEFVIGDVNEREFSIHQFDCIVSITTLHHMPLDAVVVKMREAVKPGGTILVGDFYEVSRMKKMVRKIRSAFRRLYRLLKISDDSLHSRPGWGIGHDPSEPYLPIEEVRRIYPSLLPGAQIEIVGKYYVVEWKKPSN